MSCLGGAILEMCYDNVITMVLASFLDISGRFLHSNCIYELKSHWVEAR